MGTPTKEHKTPLKPKRRTATMAEKRRRISIVQEWLVEGWSNHEIKAQVKHRTDWRIGPAQVDVYIREATSYITSQLGVDSREHLAKATARLEKLFKHSLATIEKYPTKDQYNQPVKFHEDGTPITPKRSRRDPRLALEVIKELNKIQNLTGSNGTTIGINPGSTPGGDDSGVTINIIGVDPGDI